MAVSQSLLIYTTLPQPAQSGPCLVPSCCSTTEDHFENEFYVLSSGFKYTSCWCMYYFYPYKIQSNSTASVELPSAVLPSITLLWPIEHSRCLLYCLCLFNSYWIQSHRLGCSWQPTETSLLKTRVFFNHWLVLNKASVSSNATHTNWVSGWSWCENHIQLI